MAAPPSGASQYRAAVDFLFGLKPHGPKFGFERMRAFAEVLGHPERELSTLHVGGTNGKGSVSAMLESILRAAGWRVGLFTSPHLVDVRERVQVNRALMSEPEFVEYVDQLRPFAARVEEQFGAELSPSFFEWMTAIALLHFRQTRCDIAVIEVGMGGEFDATNVILPEAVVITSVGLDHCEWLGDTVEKIARTKAGIIKRRRPVAIGRLPRAAELVIREIASWHEAPVHSVAEHFGLDVRTYPNTSLAGEYQRWNAATASLAAQSLLPKWGITTEVIAKGLGKVDWAGRWQTLHMSQRTVVLDASHNPDGADVLAMNLEQLAERSIRPRIVLGVLGSERAKPILGVVARYASELILVVPNQPRASSVDTLMALLPQGHPPVRNSTVAEIFPGGDCCTAGEAGDTVVVTGSIYLLGEVLTRLGSTEVRGRL